MGAIPSTPQRGLNFSPRLLAPLWHTWLFFGMLIAVAAAGAWLQRRAGPGSSIVPEERVLAVYLAAVLVDATFFFYVLVFVRRQGGTIADLVGGRWSRPADVLIDLAIAVPFWVVWELAALVLHRWLGPSSADHSIQGLLPRNPVEVGAWLVVCLAAGFFEEAVFRGYLQKQLAAVTGSAIVAVAGQAVAFWLGHAYQGWKNMAVISVLGILYGLLALGRRSTRPGMIAHAWSDVYSGLQIDFVWRLLPR